MITKEDWKRAKEFINAEFITERELNRIEEANKDDAVRSMIRAGLM